MPNADKDQAWHSLDIVSVLSALGATATGLTTEEAFNKLAADGPNELRMAKPIGVLRILRQQFQSLIVLLLIIAGVVSASFGEWIDATAIFAIVLLNAAIGFYQEFSAAQSIEALKNLTSPNAKLLRDGQMATIPSRDVVVGDVLTLEAGLQTASLKCIEAALTGESETVDKSPLRKLISKVWS
jgi:Ca2+-transporting ATPase